MTVGKWDLVRCDDGRLMVCTAGDIVCHPDYNHHPYDVWDARNFPKIAAAPVMLAALQRIDRWWLDEFPGGPEGSREWAGGLGNLSEDTVAIWRELQAAIALATQVQS